MVEVPFHVSLPIEPNPDLSQGANSMVGNQGMDLSDSTKVGAKATALEAGFARGRPPVLGVPSPIFTWNKSNRFGVSGAFKRKMVQTGSPPRVEGFHVKRVGGYLSWVGEVEQGKQEGSFTKLVLFLLVLLGCSAKLVSCWLPTYECSARHLLTWPNIQVGIWPPKLWVFLSAPTPMAHVHSLGMDPELDK